MARRKRLEAWAESPPEGGIYGSIVEVGPETLSVSKEEAAQGWRLVRLVECGPDETVVPKAAAAVVRAAVRSNASPGSFCVECGPRVKVDEDGCCAACGASAMGPWADWAAGVFRAVERMQKGRKK